MPGGTGDVGVPCGLEFYQRFLGIASEDRCDKTDALDEIGARVFADLLNRFIAGVAVRDVNLDLHQFVVLQGQADLLDHGLSETLLSHNDHGFAGMGEGTELLALSVVERHGSVGLKHWVRA